MPGVQIHQVLSSRADAGGLRYAEQAAIPSQTLAPQDFASPQDYGEAVFAACEKSDLVVMGGFLHYLPIPPEFENRVVNIHPSLIPAFCGQGYYGPRVHQAVLEYGAKISGCTAHFVDNEYDHGPVILQRSVPVLDDDSPETLAQRVFQAECEAYPAAILAYAQGKLKVEGRRVVFQ